MTSHELANHLLEQPDLPVMINGWGSDEGVTVEVVGSVVINTTRNSKEREEIHLLHEEIEW